MELTSIVAKLNMAPIHLVITADVFEEDALMLEDGISNCVVFINVEMVMHALPQSKEKA